MVRLNKAPSDFGTSRMRDSFLRQFVEQGTGSELLSGLTSDSQEEDAEVLLPWQP